jgi:hypothetical protein
VNPEAIARLDRSPIGRLALSLYPAEPGARLFVAFNAYYDESGTHAGSPVTVLGGFVGSADEWACLDRDWRKVLAKHDLRFIRAKQLYHREEPFRGWSDKQYRHLWADIFYAIQERRGLHLSKIVLRDTDYAQHYLQNGPKRKERLDTRYALCMRCALHTYPMALDRKNDGPVNYVLEAGHKNAGDALRVFNEVKQSKDIGWRKSIGALSFGSKVDFPALQAADFVSYWFYRTELMKIKRGTDLLIGPVEGELADCGLMVLDHVITKTDLENLRFNFRASTPKRVFYGVRGIVRGDYFADHYNDPASEDVFTFEIEDVQSSREQLQNSSRFHRI